MKKLTAVAVLAIFSLQLASAVVLNSVSSDNLSPGSDGIIRIEIENTLQDRADDISLTLFFQGLPFIPLGGSSEGIDELGEGDEEEFVFRIRASHDIDPGDYQIPYELSFKVGDERQTRKGSIGLSVRAQPVLSYSVDGEKPVVGQKGTITLKIVNKGFSDARFVSVSIVPSGFTLLSERELYIGTVDSDDFETAAFDVIFTSEKPKLSGTVSYTDFSNVQQTESISLPFKAYTRERALELGIIEKNNWPIYVGIVVVLAVLWFIWRAIRRRQRMKKSLER